MIRIGGFKYILFTFIDLSDEVAEESLVLIYFFIKIQSFYLMRVVLELNYERMMTIILFIILSIFLLID